MLTTQAAVSPSPSNSQPATIVECIGLSKSYGKVQALNQVSLSVAQGHSLGLLGENGAGKSSLVRLLLGFIQPTAGSLSLFGSSDLGAGRQRIGYLPEQPQYDRAFTASEYLRYLGKLSGLAQTSLPARVRDVLGLVGLTAAAERKIGTYSKGMSQRVGIAAALLHEPKLLIVDEPTSGLDPGGQYEIRSLLAELRGQGITMLLATHQLAEVEALCDAVAILRRGQVVVSGSVASLLAGNGQVEIVTGGLSPVVLARLATFGEQLTVTGNRLLVPAGQSDAILQILLQSQLHIARVAPIRDSLENVYLQVRPGQATPPIR